MNSLLPRNSPPPRQDSGMALAIIVSLIAFSLFVSGMFYFKDQISDTWANALEIINGYFGFWIDISGNDASGNDASDNVAPASLTPSASYASTSSDYSSAAGSSAHSHYIPPPPAYTPPSPYSTTASSSMNKILPGGGKTEVFNVSSNKYTYYDAEPLCKALGAELATYEQVKDALSQGADWCNYGWVKGQLAVYPTSEETYAKIQAGPPDQLGSCGRPGMNGGHFDNPEMRFGVNCYGKKPPKGMHNEIVAAQGPALTPETMELERKINKFKQDADHIAILPFNSNSWE